MFSIKEFENTCVVTSERGMQYTQLSKVKLSQNMARIDTTWQGRPVACAYFPGTKKSWVNTPATMVAGQVIRGNAVILGATPEEIVAEQQRPKSWVSLARQLPKTIELDLQGQARLAREQADRITAWREYFQRRSDRRKFINRDTANINLSTGGVVGELTEEEQRAADDADAAFADWNVEDDMMEIPDEELAVESD